MSPEVMTQKLEQLDATFEKQAVTVERNGDVTFWAIAVDKNKTPNRRGFLFDWKSKDQVHVDALRANGVLLYRHDDMNLPVGRIEKIVITATLVRMFCRIPGGPGYESLQWLRTWVADGYLKAVSIGFYIVGDIEEKDLGGGQKAILIHEFEIIELSLCPIGAHPSALIEQQAPRLALQRLEFPQGVYTQLKGDDETTYVFSPAPKEQAEDWRAIPYSRHGDCACAAEGDAWDGPAEKAAGTPETLAQMCALEDKSNLESKAGFKLPHHMAKGSKVIWKGVSAAMAVLLGARGGVKGISAEAKKGAYAHLAKHYGQFDKEAPAFKQDYTEAELQGLHAAGTISIPGAVEDEQTLRARNGELLTELTEARSSLAAALAENKELRTRLEAAPAAASAKVSANAQDPVVDTAAIEAAVKEYLNSPAMRGLRKTLAEAVVVQMVLTKGRAQHGPRVGSQAR